MRQLCPDLPHDHHSLRRAHENREGTPLQPVRIAAHDRRPDAGQLCVVQTGRRFRLRTLCLEIRAGVETIELNK